MGKIMLPAMPARTGEGGYPEETVARVVLARKLIKRRWTLGLSQADVARRAGICKETLWRIEKARVTADTRTVSKIMRVLESAKKVSPGDF